MKLFYKGILTYILISFCLLIGTYFILDRLIVLDRTDKELGIYDFFSSPADARLLVEGTGIQNIDGRNVTTKLKILKIEQNDSDYKLIEGQVIEVNEYFVIHKNRQIDGLQFIPGRSIYGMGTSYKRLKKGEQDIIYLKINKESTQLWISPKELIKQ